MKLLRTRGLALLTALALALSLAPITFAASVGSNDSFIASIGKPDENAIQISTPEQLAAITSDMSGSYALMNDIDMSGYGNWTPIGTSLGNPFRGKFDGQGYKITGLTVSNNFTSGTLLAPSHGVGLFGICDGAEIKNLELQNVDISISNSSGYTYAGAIDGPNVYAGSILGYGTNSTIIYNCYSSGTVKASVSGESQATSFAGGLAGYLDTAIISYSYNKCAVNTSGSNPLLLSCNSYCSGLVGYVNTDGIIVHSYNSGEIIASVGDSVTAYSGGLVGMSNASTLRITDCYNDGSVSAQSGESYFGGGTTYAGGIAGYFDGSIQRVYNGGPVTALVKDSLGIMSKANAYAGGICGQAGVAEIMNTAVVHSTASATTQGAGSAYQYRIAYGGTKTNNATISQVTSGSQNDADIVVSEEDSKSQALYASQLGWDFSQVWEMTAGKDFPQLRQLAGNGGAGGNGEASGDPLSINDKLPESLTVVVSENTKKASSQTDNYQLSNNSKIKTGTDIAETGKDGAYQIDAFPDFDSLTASKDGFASVTRTQEQLKDYPKIFLEPLEEGVPTVTAVWMNGVDIRHFENSVDLLETDSVTITADVIWDSAKGVGTIKLIQGSKSVTFSGNAVTTVLKDNFDVSETIYIWAGYDDDHATYKPLKLKAATVIPDQLDGFSFNSGDKLSFTLPDSVPLIGGKPMGVGLYSNYPVTIQVEDGKIYAAIGLQIDGSYDKKTGLTAKSFAQSVKGLKGAGSAVEQYKKVRDAMKAFGGKLARGKGSFGVDLGISVMGFAEGYLDESGVPHWLDSGVIYAASGGVNYSAPFYIGPVPLFFEMGLSAEATAQLNLLVEAKSFTPNGIIEGTISLSGGLGVGIKKVVSLSGGLEGEMGGHWEIIPDDTDYSRWTAKLKAYAKVSILFFSGSKKWELAARTWEWPDRASLQSLAMEPYAKYDSFYDPDLYTLMSEAEMTDNSVFLANSAVSLFSANDGGMEPFVADAYSQANPQLAAFSDGTLLAVWTGLDNSRDTYDRPRLYYSLCTNGVWSDPAPVNTVGIYMEADPTLTIANDTAYLAWNGANSAMGTPASMEEMASKLDIFAASFDRTNEQWAVSALTQDQIVDFSPVISGGPSGVAVAWQSNSANDLFGTSGTNSISGCQYVDGAWIPFSAQYDDIGNIVDLSIDMSENTPRIVWTQSKTEETSEGTSTAYDIYLDGVKYASGSGVLFDNGSLYWYQDGQLYQDGQDTGVALNTDRFQIENGTLLYLSGSGLYSMLMAHYYDSESGCWSDAVALTDGQQSIDSFSAASVGTSQHILVSSTEVLKALEDIQSDEDDPYGSTNLILLESMPYCDLSIGEPWYVEDTYTSGSTMTFYLDVTNNGTIPTNYIVSVSSAAGTTYSTTSQQKLLPGCTEEVAISYAQEEVLDSQLTFTVMPLESSKDANLSDNQTSLTLQYEDIAVEHIGNGVTEDGQYIVYADIVNRGYGVQSGIIVSLYQDEVSDSPLQTTTVDPLTSMASQSVSFQVPAPEDQACYIIVVTSDGTNMNAANDSDFIVCTFQESTLSYNITVGEIEHGTISAPAIAAEGETVTLRVIPGTGYQLVVGSLTVIDENEESVEVTDGEDGYTFTMPASNVTVTAEFEEAPPKTCTITYDANGGTVSPDSAITGEDGTLSELPIPTRDGYIFDGWYTAAVDGTEVDEETVFTEDTTVYAHWTAIKHHFSEDWNSDENNHWHDCEDPDCNEKSGMEAHQWGEGVETEAPTYEKEGTLTYICSVCQRTKTESVPKLGHHFSEDWSSDENDHWHDCTDPDCNEKSSVEAHKWDEGVESEAPTYEKDGTLTYTCSVCQRTKTESIPKLGHHFSEDWSSDENDHWHDCIDPDCNEKSGVESHQWDVGIETEAPTYEKDGVKTYTCTVCQRTKTESIPKPGLSNISGTVKNSEGGISGATVMLKKGNTIFGSTTSNSDGLYAFSGVATGTYNIVVQTNSATKTILITVTTVDMTGQDIIMPDGKVNSELNIVHTDGQNGTAEVDKIVVGNLDEEAVAQAEAADSSTAVTVTMKVESKDANAQEIVEAVNKITAVAPGKTLEYLAITVEKILTPSEGDASIFNLTQTIKVMEIVVPYNFSDKENVMVYRYHDGNAEALTKADSKTDATFRLDSDNGLVYIYTQKFSTYAIGYTDNTPSTSDTPSTPSTPSNPSSNSNSFSSSSSYQITTSNASNGTVTVTPKSAKLGDKVTINAVPDNGYTIGSVIVTDRSGNSISVTDNGDGIYTFTMPASAVSIDVTFVEDDGSDSDTPVIGFIDVPENEFYYDAVMWAVGQGITKGTSTNTFGPNNPCTRGQMVTFLWRAAGSPVVSSTTQFTDVPQDEFYYEPVVWAVQQGITTGTGDGKFSPNATVTRDQTVTFLYRFAGEPTVSGVSDFVDVPAGQFYTDAVTWAVENGITNGTSTSNRTFSPAEPCTRGQIVAFLYRLLAE